MRGWSFASRCFSCALPNRFLSIRRRAVCCPSLNEYFDCVMLCVVQVFPAVFRGCFANATAQHPRTPKEQSASENARKNRRLPYVDNAHPTRLRTNHKSVPSSEKGLCPKGDDPLTTDQADRALLLRTSADEGPLSGELTVTFNGETAVLDADARRTGDRECTSALQALPNIDRVACTRSAVSEFGGGDYLISLLRYRPTGSTLQNRRRLLEKPTPG